MPSWKFLVTGSYGGSQQRRLTCEKIKQIVERLEVVPKIRTGC